MVNQISTSPVILRCKEVQVRTGLSRSTLYAAIKEGAFPKQIQLTSKRSVGWIESEIIDHIQGRINVSRNVVNGGV